MVFLHDAHGITQVDAAGVAAVGAGLGSVVRPVDGPVADRAGGTAVRSGVYGIAAGLLLLLATLPPLAGLTSRGASA